MSKIDTYTKYKRAIVEPDLADFLAHHDDLRRAWHCAGSLFHLADWIYAAHKPAIDAAFTFRDKNNALKKVSNERDFANSLGQKFPDFQLIRGVANASKHFELQHVPPGQLPAGMPSHAANTYISGAAFQPGVFQPSVFQTGNVTIEADPSPIKFAPVAGAVMDMWNTLMASQGW